MPKFLENSCLDRQLQLNETTPAGISLRKRKAGKENNPSPQPNKKSRVCMEQATTHFGDHSITATEVCASILADGIDVTVINQGCDLLKQYIDTIFGAVPGFVLNIDSLPNLSYTASSQLSALESPGRPWNAVDYDATVNLPRPRHGAVQYTRIIGSRNIKDSDVDINLPEV